MNRHEVRLLQQIRQYPSLTITMPTHRSAPQNRQDPVRLKNLAGEATNRLLSEFGKREVETVLGRLDRLVAQVDFRTTTDGLALFVNRDFARAVYLPFTAKERVVVDETFATRDLVYGLNHSSRYWLLVLSEKPTRLYEGANDTLIEIEDEGFPMTHTGRGGATSLPGGKGVSRSAVRDDSHRQFFRQVDAALKPFLVDDPLPLIVAGVDRHLAFFNEVSAHTGTIAGTITGSHDKTSPHQLSQLAWPLVEQHLAERRQTALARLEKAMNDRKFASTVGEVWRLALEGRGDTLLVEEDYHYPARVDETGMHITAADDPTAPDVIDDAVDEIIEAVLDKQGEVIFLPNGALTQHQRITLILRY
jgi:hypothetical protein